MFCTDGIGTWERMALLEVTRLGDHSLQINMGLRCMMPIIGRVGTNMSGMWGRKYVRGRV